MQILRFAGTKAMWGYLIKASRLFAFCLEFNEYSTYYLSNADYSFSINSRILLRKKLKTDVKHRIQTGNISYANLELF